MDHRRSSLLALTTALFVLGAASVPTSSAAPASALHEQDRQFLYWATESAMADAALSELAVREAPRPAIRNFARQALEQDHRRVAALDALARSHGVSLPAQLDEEYRDLSGAIAAARGGAFDRLFMRTIIAEGRKAIELYDAQAARGESVDLLAFVADTLPELHKADADARRADLLLPGSAPLMSPSGTVDIHRPAPPPS